MIDLLSASLSGFSLNSSLLSRTLDGFSASSQITTDLNYPLKATIIPKLYKAEFIKKSYKAEMNA